MRIFKLLGFILFYAKEVVVSNLRVAGDVLTPKYRMHPSVIKVDVSGMTDRQLLLMANFITMTPGTLGLVFSEDRTSLYLHALFSENDSGAIARELEQTYGKRVRDVF